MNFGAVVYAKDLNRLAGFYERIADLKLHHRDATYALLQDGPFELIVHQIPAPIAASIEIASPSIRRDDTAVKLVFGVNSIAAARAAAGALGGKVDAVEREWRFGRFTVCDGHDPEGNVIQLREPAP